MSIYIPNTVSKHTIPVIALAKGKKVQQPGSRGGRYYITDQGEVRYYSQDTTMIRDFLGRNRLLFVKMANNIARRFGLPIQYESGQPVGPVADIAASAMAEVWRVGRREAKQKQGKALTKQLMVRAKDAMWAEASRQKYLVNIPRQDIEDIYRIGRAVQEYYNLHGSTPSHEQVASMVTLRRRKSGAATRRTYRPLSDEETLERIKEIREKRFATTAPSEAIQEYTHSTRPEEGALQAEAIRAQFYQAVDQGIITDRQFHILALRYGLEEHEWTAEEKEQERLSTQGAEVRDYQAVAELMQKLGWKVSKTLAYNETKAALKALRESNLFAPFTEERRSLQKTRSLARTGYERLMIEMFAEFFDEGE